MNNKTNKKLLILSIIFVIFGATITLANSSNNYLNVRPVLNRAVQTIQSIVFNEHAISNPDAPDKEVILESNHGTVMIRGRVFASTTGANNELTPESTGSSLFYGRDNKLAGKDSYIIAGRANTINSNVSGSAIIGGTNNIIKEGYNDYILGGTRNTIEEGDNSFIVGGHDNVIKGDHSYIIGGSNSSVSGNNSVAAGSDIIINKDNVFAWKDTSDDVKLEPKRENTFIWFAENGISIGYDKPSVKDIWRGTIDINGLFQVSEEAKKCGINIAGAIQFTGGLHGCFCTCDGYSWVSLIPNRKCREMCSTITGSVESDYQDGVCRYTESQHATVWSLDKSQACDNGEAVDFTQIDTPDGGKAWTWKCVGNNSTGENCYAKMKIQEGKCSVLDASNNLANFYDKCDQGYPYNIKSVGNNIYEWTCKGVNAGDSSKCQACNSNWHYFPKVGSTKAYCKNENGVCHGDTNGKTFFELDTSKLCAYGNSGNLEIVTSKETGKQTGWTWECSGIDSTAQCSASFKFEPGRCEGTHVSGIHKYGTCNRGTFTGETERDSNNIVHWKCAGINSDVVDECQGCGKNFKYNRTTGKCDRIGCDYEDLYKHYPKGEINEFGEVELTGRFVLQTCNRKLVLMDKNLGASTAGLGASSYGNYYQWGNNHGFTLNDLAKDETYTTERAIWKDSYNRGGYSSGHFVLQLDDENKCNKYNYWTDDCTVHRDMWGGDKDGYVAWNYNGNAGMDWLYTIHSNDIDDLIADSYKDYKWDVHKYVLNTGAIDRRGPCPEGWHVPAAGEWGALVMDWCSLNSSKCKDSSNNKNSALSIYRGVLVTSTSNENLGNNIMNAFLLPKAGRIMPSANYKDNRLRGNDESAYYWSSSFSSDEYVAYLWFNKSWVYATDSNGESRRGVPIRCFKNPDIIQDGEDERNVAYATYSLTIHYVDSSGKKLYNDYNGSFVNGAEYYITSYVSNNYVADKTVVSGTMPKADKEVTVTYTKK